MTGEDFTAMLTRMAKGWTTRDYNAVIENFAARLFYSDPQNYVFHDRASLLEFFEDDKGAAQDCQFHHAIFDESRQLGCAEYTYKGSFLYHGTVWVRIESDKIVEWREYQHRSQESWDEFWKR